MSQVYSSDSAPKARFIQYWENYSRAHSDLVKEHLPEEDLVLKGKFYFLDDKLKLSAKTSFSNKGESGLKNNSEYNLFHKISSHSNYNLISKSSGETFLQGNFHLSKKDDVCIDLYTDSNLKVSEENTEWVNKAHLRCVSPNAIVSFGFENWNTLQASYPGIYSAYGMLGNQHEGWSYWGGIGVGYDAKEHFIRYTKLLMALKNKNWNVYLEKKIDRSRDESEENPNPEQIFNNHSVNLIVENQVNSDVKVYGDLNYAFQKKSLDYNLVGQYTLDALTKIKLRLRGKDKSMSLGVNRRFNDFVNFSFMARAHLNAHKLENPEEDVKCPWFNYKFGAIAEFFN